MVIARRSPLRLSGHRDVIELRGSPRDQGRAHGALARDGIAANVVTVRGALAEMARRGRRYDQDAILSQNERFIQAAAPEVLDEIRGIAEGAGLPYRDVLALNAPVFVVATHLPLECTQILLRPPATRGGETYVAKTRDLRDILAQVVLHRRYPDGRELAEVNAAGSVTWPGSGVNNDGVAFGTSGTWSKRTVVEVERAAAGWLLVNGHVPLRDSRSLDEFAARLAAQPRVTPVNIVAGDATGGAALEVTVERVYRTNAADGAVVLTNHYVTPEIRHLGPTPDENASSYGRYEFATQRIQAERGTWTRGALQRLLADHGGAPQRAICRHQDAGAGADTVYASIATLPSGEFWTTLDHPCAAPASEEP